MKKFVIVLFLLFLASCTMPFGNNSSPQGKGLSVSIKTSPSIQGKTLNEGDTFSANVDVTNYFTSRKGITGYLCLRDQTGSTYGGVDDNQCIPLNIDAAENIDNKINPTGASFSFPSSGGEYSYKNLELIAPICHFGYSFY